MDLTDTIIPNSEQINAEDLLAGPRTITITAVTQGNKDQPVFIKTAEYPDRTYRPAKSMRKVLVVAWGTDSKAYVGRRITIFNDPHVRWAGKEVGGIRISALTHIDQPLTLMISTTRGQRSPFTVQPLPTDTAQHHAALTAATTLEELAAAWQAVSDAGLGKMTALVALKDARKKKLAPPAEPAPENDPAAPTEGEPV